MIKLFSDIISLLIFIALTVCAVALVVLAVKFLLWSMAW